MTLRGAIAAIATAAIAAAAVPLEAAAAPSGVAVLCKENGYYASLARHARRWLDGHGVKNSLSVAEPPSKALAAASVAFLVGYDSPSKTEMAAFEAFAKRGGKFVVFYSSSPGLAALMGVKVVGFRRAPCPGRWSRMDFAGRTPEGRPDSILQTSTVLQLAEPVPGKSRTIATWSDRSGRPTGDAAWIASARGYWMTHVMLADGDETLKARLLASMAGSLDPALWNYAAYKAKAAAERKALAAYAAAQQPRRGEIRAVWDHSGCGLYPGNWPKTIAVLKSRGVTDLFLNVGGPGFAHYNSSILPHSPVYSSEGDQLAKCLDAARGSGMRVHAWLMCFNATRATRARLASFEKAGWMLKTRDGAATEYLDPSKEGVRRHLFAAIDELCANYKIAGIHLDFVRWYEKSPRPPDAADIVTRFVAEARTHVVKPKWLTAAVLGKYPSCVASVAQDWTQWLGYNLVDYVVPMDYTEDLAKFESFARQHAWLKTHARRTIAGIGVTANESRLDARAVIGQILTARKYNLAGVALFDLDTTLEKDIFPYLAAGVWK